MQNSALKGLEEKFYACWFLTDDAWNPIVFASNLVEFLIARTFSKLQTLTVFAVFCGLVSSKNPIAIHTSSVKDLLIIY
jgi:hypothetical protein